MLADILANRSGIPAGSPECETLARSILTLFTGGMTAIDDLKPALTGTRDTA